MEQKSILSSGQNNIEPTQNQFDLNQFSYQIPPQQFEIQEDSSNIKNELENSNIAMISDQTIQKKIKRQIARSLQSQNKIQNAICQVINQKEDQHVILSYKTHGNKNCSQHISSNHQKIIQKDKNSKQNDFSQKEGQIEQKQINQQQPNCFEQKINFKELKDEQENRKELSLKPEQINSQGNEKQQKEVIYQDYQQSKNNFSKKEDQIRLNQITKEPAFNNQVDCKQIKENQEKADLYFQNRDMQNTSVQNLKDNLISILENPTQQKNNGIEKNQSQQQNLQIEQSNQIFQKDTLNLENISKQEGQSSKNSARALTHQNTQIIQQEIQSISIQQAQQGINTNFEKQNNLYQSFSLQLKTIFDQIMAYQFYDYDERYEQDCNGIYKKIWEQEIFDRVNENQSEIFKSHKSQIFERLKNEQLFLCKIVNSNQIEDLILGLFLEEQADEEYIFKIIYSSAQSNIDLQNQMIETLGLQSEVIILEQENISILGFKKNDYLFISNKFEQLVQFKSNIQQIENNYEINSLNYQDQYDKIEQTQNQLDVNQLSQKVSDPQLFQNQESSPNILNYLEDSNIAMISEQTLLKKVKSQIYKRIACQNSILQNAMCQIINQKKDQNVIVSYQNQCNKNCIQPISSKDQKTFLQEQNSLQKDFNQIESSIKQKQTKIDQFPNYEIDCQYIKQFQEKTDSNLQKNEQEKNNQLTLKHEQSKDLQHDNNQKNSEKETFQQENQYSKIDFIKKEDSIKKNQITKEPNFNSQEDCKQIKEIQEKTIINLPNSEHHSNNVQDLKDLQIFNQENITQQENIRKDQNQIQQQDQHINGQQKIIQQQDHVQQKDILNQENITEQEGQSSKDKMNIHILQNTPIIQQEIQNIMSQQNQQEINKNIEKQNNLCQSYSSQLKTIFDQIKTYQFNDYEQQFESDQVVFYKKVWQQEIFEKINGSEIQGEIFKSQKSKIFEMLKKEQLYLCKVVNSNQIEDLILGFFLDEYDNFDECENFNEYIFKIIYSPAQSDIHLQNQILNTLGFQLQIIKLEQENISILGLKKMIILPFQINLKKEDKNQKTMIDQVQLNQEQPNSELKNFFQKTVVSFLEDNQNGQLNTCQQDSIYCCESISEKQQHFVLEIDNKQKNEFDLVNKCSKELNQEEHISELKNFVHETIFSSLEKTKLKS
ncbi:hypothetical protein ABPG73_021833 [Tetrahymena malaccensis]